MTRSSRDGWKRALRRLSAPIRGLIDPRASAVRQHDLERVLTRLADDKGAHLKRAVEESSVSQAGKGNVIFDGAVATHRDAVSRGTFSVQNNGVILNLSRAILVDKEQPALLPVPIVGALATITGLAQVDAIAVLDRLAASQIQCIGDEVSVVCQALSGNPIAVGRDGSGQQHTENDQGDHDLDQREAATDVAAAPAAEPSCLHADLPGLRSAKEGSRVSQIVVGGTVEWDSTFGLSVRSD
jgi:hypothetical protein